MSTEDSFDHWKLGIDYLFAVVNELDRTHVHFRVVLAKKVTSPARGFGSWLTSIHIAVRVCQLLHSNIILSDYTVSILRKYQGKEGDNSCRGAQVPITQKRFGK
jgi:hypothetical protein